MAIATTEPIPSDYAVLRAAQIPRLDGTLYDLVHERTGARHVHLAVPDRNSYFCALYRTPPDDSTGAPHVMEHCVSGGSRRFPPGAGGDMYNRSLLTDVNGMTSADYTTYYIASRNKRDYMNWLEYIVDVTLFPRMDRDHFLRHGGHFEFNEPSDITSGQRFTGTVYNEMKATFASPQTHGFRALGRALFPGGHTYSQSSGGDPAEMRSLTYDYILGFKERFYHPGNAVYVSRGDVPLGEILSATEEIVGDSFERKPATATAEIPRVDGPVAAEAPLPASSADEDGHLLFGWVAGDVSHSFTRLSTEIACETLFEAANAPVHAALQQSGLVRGPIRAHVVPHRRMMVVLWVSGINPGDASSVDDVVRTAMDVTARGGFDAREVDAAIARLELRRREPSNGIGVFLEMVIPALVHGGDPYTALELDSDVARLGESRGDDVLEALVQMQLIDNPHRARVSLVPDPKLEERVRDEEASWVAAIEATLGDEDKQAVVEETTRLTAQPSADYPRRGLEPAEALTTLTSPERRRSISGGAIELIEEATDGITYLTARFDLGGIDDELVPYVGLLESLLLKRARGGGSRVDAVRVVSHARTDADGRHALHWLELSGRVLSRDGGELAAMLHRSLDTAPPGSELVSELAAERATALEQGIFANAQVHLRRLAGASLRRSARIDDETRGLGQLRSLKKDKVDAGRMEEVLAVMLDRGRVASCLVGADADIARLSDDVSEVVAGLGSQRVPSTPAADVLDGPRPHRARVAQLPVAFTCAAYTIPGLGHADGPAIAVLAQALWSGFLNNEVRKGGAYGVDFAALPERGLLWISSRRDPLPAKTYEAIDAGIQRFADGTWEATSADDAKIGILRTTDPVDSPATAARRAWLGTFTGHTTDAWNGYRRRVLDVSDDDLARVAAAHLTNPSRATLVGPAIREGDYDEIEEV